MNASDRWVRFVVSLFSLAWSGSIAAADVTTFRVSVPSGTTGTVYLAGSFQGWNPGDAAYALTDAGANVWEITLFLPDGVPIEYKFTRGTWGTVEKSATGAEIANRQFTPSGAATLEHTVGSWADGQPSTITGDVRTRSFPAFLNGRTVRVYLPPAYDTSTATYPVLYMHDGQNLFDDATSFAGEWRVDEACEALIAAGEIEPMIVVGIDNSAARISEYTPWPASGFGGGGGDAYLRAIRDHLIPAINANYRTRTGAEHTSIAGSSLGGLISAYAAFEYADTFSRAAAVSPSYWWANQRLTQHVAQAGRPPGLIRLYQDMGTAESSSGVPNLRAMRDVLLGQGFVLGEDLDSVEFAGHTHSEFYWAQRFPSILRALFEAPPCPPDLNGDSVVDNGDIGAFVALFLTGDLAADFNADGLLDNGDIGAFVAAFLAGCD